MSQAGILDVESSNPQIPTSFVTDSGIAVPILNVLEILGGPNVTTSAVGNVITITATGFNETLTGNTGGPISPVAGNINTIGSGSITISGAGNTLTTHLFGLTQHNVLIGGASSDTIANVAPGAAGTVLTSNGVGADPSFQVPVVTTDLHVAKWIVNAIPNSGGNQTTIQNAINAAVSGETVFIMPGTYTENLTLKAGVSLVAFTSEFSTSSSVNIVGNASISSGTVIMESVCLRTNGGSVITGTGGTVILVDCFILSTNGVPFTLSNTTLTLLDCNGIDTNTGQIFAATNATTLTMKNCLYTGNGTTPSSLANSTGLTVRNSTFQLPITTSDTVTLLLYNSHFGVSSVNTTKITTSGTGVLNTAYNCIFESGSASAISIGAGTAFKLSNCAVSSSNTNPITGAGTVTYSGLTFPNTGSTINVTTQAPQQSSNDTVKVTTPGAYPYTTVPQDNVILVDTSSARTITPLASPATGQVHRIKDSVGSAAANNITITPSGKNIDGAASSVINIAYGSVDIVYNGAEWSIL